VKKIIIEVPDEFDVKIDLSKDCRAWLEDGESIVGYAKFDRAGKYNLSKGKDELLNLDAVGYTELIGHRQNGDVVLGGDIYAFKNKEASKEPKKKIKPHPNPGTRKFKKGISYD